MPNKFLESILEQEQKKKKTVKQQRVIESAIRLFAEKGYSNTSTAEIAKLAEVSEGTIFKHYGTKERLLISIVVPFMKEFLPSIAEEVLEQIFKKELTFSEVLKAFVVNRLAFISENKEIFQVLIKEIIYREELRNELLPFFIKELSIFYYQVFDEFKTRGEISDIANEELLKHTFLSIGGFFISQFIIFDKETVTDAEVDSLIYFTMKGIGA